jgi:hypothetical protein
VGDFAGRVLSIKMVRHRAPKKITGRVLNAVVKFHLDLLAMCAKVESQVERLEDLASSDIEDSEEDEEEEEEGIDSDDEPAFLIKPLFDSGGNKFK